MLQKDYIVRAKNKNLYIESSRKEIKKTIIKSVILIFMLSVLMTLFIHSLLIFGILMYGFNAWLIIGVVPHYWKVEIENCTVTIKQGIEKKREISFDDLISVGYSYMKEYDPSRNRNFTIRKYLKLEFIENEKIKIVELPIEVDYIRKNKKTEKEIYVEEEKIEEVCNLFKTKNQMLNEELKDKEEYNFINGNYALDIEKYEATRQKFGFDLFLHTKIILFFTVAMLILFIVLNWEKYVVR